MSTSFTFAMDATNPIFTAPMHRNDGIVDSPRWDRGDFALVSFDAIRFLIDGYHLMSAR